MIARHPWVLPLLALGAGCDAEPAPKPPPEVLADPVDPGTRLAFSGLVLLEGDLSRETGGSIVVTVQYVGDRIPLLQRCYEIGDPWRAGDAFPFGLSVADKVVDPLPPFGRHMQLVVRYDADGNPATRGPGDVQSALTVATGSSDVAVALRRAESGTARVADK